LKLTGPSVIEHEVEAEQLLLLLASLVPSEYRVALTCSVVLAHPVS
jgi:hypothetical protein